MMSSSSTISSGSRSSQSAGYEGSIELESPLHSVSRFLLVAALFVSPWLYGAVQPWAWGCLVLLAATLLFMWGLGCIQDGVLRLVWSPLYWPGVLFLTVGIVQLLGHRSLDRFGTRESLLKLVAGLIFFFLACQLFGGRKDRSGVHAGFGFAVSLLAFVMSLFAILQYVSSRNLNLVYWTVKSPGWTFGPYINHNHYGGLMEMLIPIAVTFFLSRSRTDPLRPLLGFASLLPLASLLLSGSRGAFISLLVEVLILGGILLWLSPAERRRDVTLGVSFVLVVAALFFLWIDPGDVSTRLATVFHRGGAAEVSMNGRLVVSRDSLGIVRDHPVLGTGLGSFGVVYPRYMSFSSDLLWDHAHDDYVEALAETGIVGGVIILFALMLFFPLAFGGLRERLRGEAGWIQLGAALGCCGLLVHSFVDFNLHIPANAAWFAVCAGIATARLQPHHDTLGEHHSPALCGKPV